MIRQEVEDGDDGLTLAVGAGDLLILVQDRQTDQDVRIGRLEVDRGHVVRLHADRVSVRRDGVRERERLQVSGPFSLHFALKLQIYKVNVNGGLKQVEEYGQCGPW